MSELTLYSYWRSSCSWRVRIVLELKDIPYNVIPIHLVKENKSKKEFGKLNPLKQVPALGLGSGQRVLTQSVAIIEYLEEAEEFKGKFPLMPKDAWKRAQVRRLVEIVNSGIQPRM